MNDGSTILMGVCGTLAGTKTIARLKTSSGNPPNSDDIYTDTSSFTTNFYAIGLSI
jgi:hypothetical protein